jgi:hypothetical protein
MPKGKMMGRYLNLGKKRENGEYCMIRDLP